MARTLIRRVFRRLGFATLLVLLVSSSALVLARLAPGDTTDAFDARTPEQIARIEGGSASISPHEVWPVARHASSGGSRHVADLPAARERAGGGAVRQHGAAGLHGARARHGCRSPARRLHREPPPRSHPAARARRLPAALSAPPLLTSLALVLLAAREPAGCRSAVSGPSGTSSSPRSRWPCRRWARSSGSRAGALSETLHERFMVAAVARGPGSLAALAPRVPRLARARARRLRHHRRVALQRIVRRRDRDELARPGAAHVRRAHRAGHSPRGGMRRGGSCFLAAASRRMRPWPGPTRERERRRDARPGRGRDLVALWIVAGSSRHSCHPTRRRRSSSCRMRRRCARTSST